MSDTGTLQRITPPLLVMGGTDAAYRFEEFEGVVYHLRVNGETVDYLVVQHDGKIVFRPDTELTLAVPYVPESPDWAKVFAEEVERNHKHVVAERNHAALARRTIIQLITEQGSVTREDVRREFGCTGSVFEYEPDSFADEALKVLCGLSEIVWNEESQTYVSWDSWLGVEVPPALVPDVPPDPFAASAPETSTAQAADLSDMRLPWENGTPTEDDPVPYISDYDSDDDEGGEVTG